MRNLTVSGPTDEHHGIDGIFAKAGLNLNNVEISDIRCTADGADICGVQYGRPVLAEGSGDVVISGCTITRFQKQAIDLNTSGTAEISNTEIIGCGPQQIITQNGILIRKGAARITGCAISDMSYTADNEYKNSSVGIYAFGGAAVQVNGTTVKNVDFAIETDDAGTTLSGSNNCITSLYRHVNNAGGTVELTKCYWGDAPDFSNMANVTYLPYYTDAAMTALAADIGGVTLSNTSLEAAKGDRIFLSAAVTPENAYDKTVVWSSSNEQIATVKDGVVTVIAENGSATVTATAANGKSAACKVTVKKTTEKPITIPGTDDEKVLEVRPGVEGNIVDSGMISSAVEAASRDEIILVSIPKEAAGSAVIEGSAIKEAAERAQKNDGAQTLALTTADENGNVKSVITIDLANIKDLEAIGDINIGATNEVDKALGEKVAESLPDNAAVFFINLAHDGKFPFPITRSDYVGGKYKEGTAVYLYWVNENGALSERQALTVDANGYITYTIAHASPYVVTDTAAVQAKIKVDVPQILSSEYPYTGTEIQAQFEPYDADVIECDNTKGTEVGTYVTVFRLKDKTRYEWNTDTNQDGEWQYTWKITAVTEPGPSASPAPSTSPNPSASPNPSVSPSPTVSPNPSTAPTAAPSAGPKTGDCGNNAVPIILVAVAAAGIVSFAAVKIRKKSR